MAKQILAVLVSTIAVEQEFSAGGNILNATCSSLSPDSIQGQTCLDDCIKTQYRQQKIDQKPTYEYFKNDQTTEIEGSSWGFNKMYKNYVNFDFSKS